ncbi:Phosphatidate cytidylyltransferase [Planctomycetes bacterium Poly30]|uniref:Phosphatidate cytidylyltransferase n=1 Tax=Saltatorellus ferox TaxID=2528018 RepID=A0A518ER46_9BACT|nr:Phosphatidate cytidylyltransferase [Planctomycetes bacterium Poly30]
MSGADTSSEFEQPVAGDQEKGAADQAKGAGDQAQGMTRRQKVVQRTKVGGGLAVVVAGLLYAASLGPGPQITLGLGVVLSLWSLVEVRRMGLFLSPLGFVVAALSTIGFAAMQVLEPDAVGAAARGLASNPFLVIAGLSLPLAALTFRTTVRHARAGTKPPVKAVSTVLLLVTVALPLLALYPIRLAGGAAGLAAYIGLAKIGDIAGYYFGNLMGKRKPFPSISPGKTVAGCNASLITAVLVGALFVQMGVLDGARYGLVSGAALGAAVNLLAQAGDLLESAYKRRAGFKDSGTTFGPSGGMFDLIDSLILSAPVAALLWPYLFQSRALQP